MRIYDATTPDGRVIPAVEVAAYAAEQYAYSIHAGAPLCPVCGHRQRLRKSLTETPWHTMKPDSPSWETETNRRLAALRSEMDDLRAHGRSQYTCAVCTGGQWSAKRNRY